jgi:hypothetical protein
MTKACVQHIAKNAKEKLHNRKEKQLRKSNTRNNYSNNKEVFFTRQNLRRVSLQTREGGT